MASHSILEQCTLYCYTGSGNLYSPAGMVDDGTHCNDDSGACVNGVCQPMPQYVAPTTPPPTNGQGKIVHAVRYGLMDFYMSFPSLFSFLFPSYHSITFQFISCRFRAAQ